MRIIKKNGQLSVVKSLHEDPTNVHHPNNSINNHYKNSNKSNNKDSSNSNKDKSIWVDNRGNDEFEILMREQGGVILRTKRALMARHKSLMSANDIESAINMGLYRAFLSFDPTRGFVFATYFGAVAYREIKSAHRDYKRFNGSYTTKSGYTRVNTSYDIEDKDILSMIDLLTSRRDNTDNICEAKDVLTLVDELLKDLDERFTSIIHLVSIEYRTKDIADELGISSPTVSKAKKKFINLFCEKYPELEEYVKSL